MPILNLKNIAINEKQTISGETYFLIKDNETDQAYFCFQNKVKSGWQDLVSNWGNLKEVEIEFIENERGNKVISLFAVGEGEIII